MKISVIGYMYKRQWLKWRKRWFQLNSDGLLHRYQDEDSETEKGVPLNIHQFIDVKEMKYHNYPFGIELKFCDATWTFACESRLEKQKWIDIFRKIQNV